MDAADTAAPSPKNATTWRSATIWILTTVGAAAVGITLKDVWEAPRAHVQLVSLDLRPHKSRSAIKLDPALLEQIGEHAYFPNIDRETDTDTILEKVQTAEQLDPQYQELVARIDKLIELLRNRGGDVTDRRKEFLRLWGKGVDNYLESITKAVLPEYEQHLPERYQKHPVGSEGLYVQLAPGQVMDLTELDEERFAQEESRVSGPVNVYGRVKRDAHNTNLLRRLWVYLEPPIFIPLLEQVKSLTVTWIDSSRSIAKLVREGIAAQNPDYIDVVVLVANTGARPLPIRQLGLLWLKLPGRIAGSDNEYVPIPMGDAPIEGDVIVIDGGTAKTFALSSRKSLADVVEGNPALQGDPAAGVEKSRFRQLLDGGGLAAAVALARAGGTANAAALAPSEFRPVGRQSTEGLFEQLKLTRPSE